MYRIVLIFGIKEFLSGLWSWIKGILSDMVHFALNPIKSIVDFIVWMPTTKELPKGFYSIYSEIVVPLTVFLLFLFLLVVLLMTIFKPGKVRFNKYLTSCLIVLFLTLMWWDLNQIFMNFVQNFYDGFGEMIIDRMGTGFKIGSILSSSIAVAALLIWSPIGVIIVGGALLMFAIQKLAITVFSVFMPLILALWAISKAGIGFIEDKVQTFLSMYFTFLLMPVPTVLIIGVSYAFMSASSKNIIGGIGGPIGNFVLLLFGLGGFTISFFIPLVLFKTGQKSIKVVSGEVFNAVTAMKEADSLRKSVGSFTGRSKTAMEADSTKKKISQFGSAAKKGLAELNKAGSRFQYEYKHQNKRFNPKKKFRGNEFNSMKPEIDAKAEERKEYIDKKYGDESDYSDLTKEEISFVEDTNESEIHDSAKKIGGNVQKDVAKILDEGGSIDDVSGQQLDVLQSSAFIGDRYRREYHRNMAGEEMKLRRQLKQEDLSRDEREKKKRELQNIESALSTYRKQHKTNVLEEYGEVMEKIDSDEIPSVLGSSLLYSDEIQKSELGSLGFGGVSDMVVSGEDMAQFEEQIDSNGLREQAFSFATEKYARHPPEASGKIETEGSGLTDKEKNVINLVSTRNRQDEIQVSESRVLKEATLKDPRYLKKQGGLSTIEDKISWLKTQDSLSGRQQAVLDNLEEAARIQYSETGSLDRARQNLGEENVRELVGSEGFSVDNVDLEDVDVLAEFDDRAFEDYVRSVGSPSELLNKTLEGEIELENDDVEKLFVGLRENKNIQHDVSFDDINMVVDNMDGLGIDTNTLDGFLESYYGSISPEKIVDRIGDAEEVEQRSISRVVRDRSSDLSDSQLVSLSEEIDSIDRLDIQRRIDRSVEEAIDGMEAGVDINGERISEIIKQHGGLDYRMVESAIEKLVESEYSRFDPELMESVGKIYDDMGEEIEEEIDRGLEQIVSYTYTENREKYDSLKNENEDIRKALLYTGYETIDVE